MTAKAGCGRTTSRNASQAPSPSRVTTRPSRAISEPGCALIQATESGVMITCDADTEAIASMTPSTTPTQSASKLKTLNRNRTTNVSG